MNDCQRTACPSRLQAEARGRHRQTDNAAIAAAWIMPFCYGPLRAPRTIVSLQATKALRWQPCTELQASDQSKRNANPGRGSRNCIVATSHGLSRFLGASCLFWALRWFRGDGGLLARAPFHVVCGARGANRLARSCQRWMKFTRVKTKARNHCSCLTTKRLQPQWVAEKYRQPAQR